MLRTYVARLAESLPGSDLRLMTSAGGLVAAESFTGKDSILSGPAGGVVGFSRVAQAAGFTKAIGFDMGGTSTDVSRFDGHFEYEYETEKAGVRIVAPMLAIETVAAGGGSICRFDGVKLVVGPESAGADPGPACYGRGGPLTVTDCNFYLGRLLPEHFPFPLDRAAVERRLAEVAPTELTMATGAAILGMTTSSLAAGFVRIANANMAQAIRTISLAKGYDPRDYVLVAVRRRGAAARLRGRRRAGHPHDPAPSRRRRAERARHRPGRRREAPLGGRLSTARRSGTCSTRQRFPSHSCKKRSPTSLPKRVARREIATARPL